MLPGIGGDEASVVLAPLYVLDQYDAVMQTGVAAANYKLYKVDGETKTPISADYAKFEDGSEGRVTLKPVSYTHLSPRRWPMRTRSLPASAS